MNHDRLLVPPGTALNLKKHDTAFTGKFKSKEDAARKLEKDILELERLQSILYAQDIFAVLLIFQAMDAAGKDSTIKHIMTGVNPQGVQVVSFKSPSAEEADHDFMWRCLKVLPERGRIGIFNRSYYEETLIVRVHPEIFAREKLPRQARGKDVWKHRYEDINNIERYLTRNGMIIFKFFLHVSKDEQKKRFLERIETPEKNWKFAADDLKERERWDDYMKAYEDTLSHTSTEWAPWFVIPADHKWFARAAVADIIVSRLGNIQLAYPEVTAEHKKELEESKKILLKEGA